MHLLNSRKRTSFLHSIAPIQDSDKWKSVKHSSAVVSEECSEESSSDEDSQTNDLVDWENEFFGRESIDQTKNDEDVEVKLTRKQTFVLSTLISNELLLMKNFDDKPKRFVGVLLMADVSGYTALSEKYANTGKGGPYRLTVTLNSYLGALIDLIYRHGGDVQKFAGDAFLALWKLDKKTFLSHVIHDVILCALVIQHSYGNYETDVKVNLKVKLAISAGNIYCATIGSGLNMNFVMCGLPVFEAKYTESVCESGDIKLSATAWAHCYSRNYDHIINRDGTVTIKSILYDPRDRDVSRPYSGFGQVLKQVKKPFNYDLNESVLENPDTLSPTDTIKRNEALSLRDCILKAEQTQVGSEIRRFMIRPVLTQIDAHQPLEYLTEMRDVSILFITLKPKPCPFLQLINIVDNAYKITCDVTYKSMGCINKIILFDKDVMILVVFGLRGFKHASEAQAALKSAFMIRKLVSALDGVLEVSIGVTTGRVYCGVVGHPLRREFTVIGSVVNKAARLMCYYRERVSCDETTFVKSKMSKNGFTLLERKELKGMTNVGKIYEYSEDIRTNVMYDITLISPLLNRRDEMAYFTSCLDKKHPPNKDYNALLLIGEQRSGKTRLLEWMYRYSKNKKYDTSYISLSTIHSSSPYLGLTQIFDQMLKLSPYPTGFEKEEKIVELLKYYEEDLCYLNNIIKVRYAFYEGMNTYNENYRLTKAKIMFEKIIKAINIRQILFWDDLQNLDPLSWEFVSIMLRSNYIFSVFTVNRGKFPVSQQWLYNVFIDDHVRKMALDSIPTQFIPPMACQMLNVDGIASELCNSLLSKSNGVPGHIETLVLHLFSSGGVEILKIPQNELSNYESHNLVFPEAELIKPLAFNESDQEILDQFIEKDKKDEISICVVHDRDVILRTNIHAQNTDALIMMQLDSLTPYQQLLLKIGSVIGIIFARDLLENIMYENNRITTARAIKRLFSMKILMCANKKKRVMRKQTKVMSIEMLTCDCPFEHNPEENENLPKFAFCKYLKFRNKNIRNTCYELLPINQKKEFHSRVVYYLENSNTKCEECGGMTLVISPDSYLYRRRSTHASKVSMSLSCYDSENEISKCDLPSTRTQSVESERRNSVIGELKPITARNRNGPPGNSVRLKSTVSEMFAFRRRSVVISAPVFEEGSGSETDTEVEEETTTIFDNLRSITEASSIEDWNNMGIYDSEDEESTNKELFFRIQLEEGASATNFLKCTCIDVQLTTYEQLILHAGLAEMKIKTIEFLLKFSELNISANCFEMVIIKTEEAEKMCENLDAVTQLDKKTIKRFLGKIYTIRAQASMMSGRLLAAKSDLEKALKIYKIDCNANKNIMRFKNYVSNKYTHHVLRINKLMMMSDSVCCLNTATTLYSSQGDLKMAKMTSQIALEIVLKNDCDFANFSETLSNAIEIELQRGYPEYTLQIEKVTHSALKRYSKCVPSSELCILGKLFSSSYHARIARGQMSAATRTGFKAYTLSRFLYAHQISLDIVPDLFYLLLARKRIGEAVQLAHDLKSLSQMNSVTMYYALCIDMILDAGIQLEPISEIQKYAQNLLQRLVTNDVGRRRLIAGMWVYWLRADDETNVKLFEEEAMRGLTNRYDIGSLAWLLNGMRTADGMLESLARKVDDLRKVVDLLNLKSLAEKELTRMEVNSKCCKSIIPRWHYLKSCSYKLAGRSTAATSSLNQALDEARKYRNRLEEAIITGNSRTSNIWFQNAIVGKFPDWQEGVDIVQTKWPDYVYKMKSLRSNKLPDNIHNVSSFLSITKNRTSYY